MFNFSAHKKLISKRLYYIWREMIFVLNTKQVLSNVWLLRYLPSNWVNIVFFIKTFVLLLFCMVNECSSDTTGVRLLLRASSSSSPFRFFGALLTLFSLQNEFRSLHPRYNCHPFRPSSANLSAGYLKILPIPTPCHFRPIVSGSTRSLRRDRQQNNNSAMGRDSRLGPHL